MSGARSPSDLCPHLQGLVEHMAAVSGGSNAIDISTARRRAGLTKGVVMTDEIDDRLSGEAELRLGLVLSFRH